MPDAVKVAEQLADEFRGRAAECDRTGEFPAANYARMKEAGYLRAPCRPSNPDWAPASLDVVRTAGARAWWLDGAGATCLFRVGATAMPGEQDGWSRC
jgi:hypothetical protein